MQANLLRNRKTIGKDLSGELVLALPVGKSDGFGTASFEDQLDSKHLNVAPNIIRSADTTETEATSGLEGRVIHLPREGGFGMDELSKEKLESTNPIVDTRHLNDVMNIIRSADTTETEATSDQEGKITHLPKKGGFGMDEFSKEKLESTNSIIDTRHLNDKPSIIRSADVLETESDSMQEGIIIHMPNGGSFMPGKTSGSKIGFSSLVYSKIMDDESVGLPELLKAGAQKIISSVYALSGIGYFMIVRKAYASRISNFTISSISKTIVIDANEEKSIENTFEFGNLDNKYKLVLPLKETLNLGPHIEQAYPDCMIFVEQGRNAKEIFRRVVSKLYSKMASRRTSTIYSFSGWSPLTEGCRIYLHGGRPDCRTEVKLPPENSATDVEMIKKAMEISRVAEKSIIRPLVCYQIESFLSAPFEDAGFPNRHSLMMVGPTGSGKTSLARVIFAPFQPKRIHSFRDTSASFRISVENARDNIFLLDDFLQEGHRSKITEMKEKLWSLVRAYSDSTFGAKYKNSKENFETKVRGGCVITAEEEPTSEMESASLRYIKVQFHEINWNFLTDYQTNPEIFSVFYASVIRFIESHYSDIVSFLKREFPLARAEYSKRLKKNRMADTAADLYLSSRVLSAFLKENGIWTEETANDWEAESKEIFARLVEENEKSSRARKPVTRFLMALMDLQASRQCCFAPNIDEYIARTEWYQGYYTLEEGTGRKLLFLQAKATFHSVDSYLSKAEDYLNVNPKTIYSQLKSLDLSVCDKGSNLKRPSAKLPHRVRMLCLNMDNVDKYLQKEEGLSISNS